MPLDPQARRALDRTAALGLPSTGTVSAEVLRASMRARRIMEVADRTIPGPGGPLPLRIYTPAEPRPLPMLVYLHGGGWVTGDLDVSDLRCRILAEWAACIVVSVHYRLAPEHPFPAAIEDAYAATLWTSENAGALQGDPGRLAVGGDSAGGNLAAAVALQARDTGKPQIVFQYLVYPVVGCTMDWPSYRENAEGYGLGRSAMEWYLDQYLPNKADRTNPLAAPILAADLRGLPPAIVMTAEYDPLRDEGEAYGRRLQEAGVPTELKRYPGMVHGFMGQAAELDQGKQAMIDSAAALRNAFAQAVG